MRVSKFHIYAAMGFCFRLDFLVIRDCNIKGVCSSKGGCCRGIVNIFRLSRPNGIFCEI